MAGARRSGFRLPGLRGVGGNRAPRPPSGRARRSLGFEPLECRALLAIDVQVRFEFSEAGQPVQELQVGDDFTLNVYVQDIREDAAGLFQAFFDVNYSDALISATGGVSHGAFYNQGTFGSVSAGLIDDAGGVDTDQQAPSPAGTEFLLFSVPFHADAAGQLNLSTSLPTNPTRQVLLFDRVSVTPIADIQFVGDTIEIAAAPVPQVSIAATQNGNEAGPTPGVFTVTQSLTTSSNTVVQYSVGGTATSGSDFSPLSGTATILAGQTSTTINVPVLNDAIVEATETVSVTLTGVSQSAPGVVIAPNASQDTLEILDNDAAQVRIAAMTGGNETGPVGGAFTITQTAVSSTNTVVTFTLGGTATSGSDYAAIATTATILAGNTTATISVPVIDDQVVEGPETVIATLTGITAGDPQITLQGGATQATLNIADNDTALVRIVRTSDGTESGPAAGVFTITQTAVTASNTVVTYSLSGTATPGSDYSVPSGTATIVAGMTTATITVPVINDDLVEADETVIVTLNSITSGNPQVIIDPAAREATMSIADDDSALVRIAKTSDGNESGPADGVFTVTQTAQSSTNTVVSYTVGGTATPGSDYTALSGTVTIPAGQTSATINVPVIDDDEGETTETVIVTLTGVTAGDPQIQIDGGQDQAIVEITDDETPLVRIAATNDGDESGPLDGSFTVSQTLVASVNTVISYTVTGTAASGDDFAPLSGTATILAGDTTAVIDVAVLDDNLIEGAETVVLMLTGITSGDERLEIDPANDDATIEIADDETGLVSIAATQDGSEAGPVDGQFTVTQDGISALDTVIAYTVSGTATAGDDYATLSGSVTIPAGETAATILLSVNDDALVEPDETVTITLEAVSEGSPPVGIDPAQAAATASIEDDDTATVAFSAASNGSEDGPIDGQFTIVQSAISSTDTVIQYSIGGTAASGGDYAALSGTVTIPAGETTAVIDIAVIDDIVVENTETVTLTLTSLDAGGARVTIDENQATRTIEIPDNDTAQVSVVTTSDGSEAGPASVVFTVMLTAPSSTDTEIQYTLGGTATAGNDYTALSGTLVIPAGSTSQPLEISVLDDVVLEGPETVTAALDAISAGDPQITINDDSASAAADIVDDETGLIGITVSAEASEAGPTGGVFTVGQSGTTEVDTVISYTVGGTATPDVDYVMLSGTLMIPAGQTSATIDVTVLGDLLIEGDETVIVTLDSITSGDERLAIDSGANAATMTIVEDDTGLVSIAAGENGSETGPVPATFLVTQSGIADVDTIVSYTVSGTADGGDIAPLSGTVSIPAGETMATITIDPIDDGVVEDAETVVITLVEITSGSPLVSVDPNNHTATVEIADNDSAQISLTATTPGNESGPTAGVFTVTQSAPSSTDTVISYTIGGTATSGSDYTPLSGTVTIPAGETSATINVPVIDDAAVEGTETVTLTLSEITAGDPDITLDDQQSAAAVDIQDDDNALISFVNDSSSVLEVLGSHSVVVRLSIAGGGTLAQSVTVDVSAAGTASAADFTLQTMSVTFAAGSSNGEEQIVSLSIVDDGALEPEETIILSLSIGTDNTGGQSAIGDVGTHTVTIVDDSRTGVISGLVWVDANGNGRHDAAEIVIPGVTVRLVGVDGLAQPVERTTTTGEDGIYAFIDLPVGTYELIEQQPQAFYDAGESLGTVNGSPSGQVGDDRFTGISLGAAGQGGDYNFGEWGLRAEYVNVRFFLATTPLHDFILRDTIQAAETAPRGLRATASSVVTFIAPTQTATRAATAAPAPPVTPRAALASPVTAPASSAASVSPPAEPVSVANFVASTLAAGSYGVEPDLAAVAFAAAMADDDTSTEGMTAAGPLAAVGDDSEDAPQGQSAAGVLLEDQDDDIVETAADELSANEQLTDQALDEEESWLDPLVA